MSNVLELRNICKSFGKGNLRVEVLKDVSLHVAAGEIVSLLGPSGSGKSTLLHIAGILSSADSGEVMIDGEKVFSLNDDRRTDLRLKKIGFVYQAHHLLADFTALENVMQPMLWNGLAKKEATFRAAKLLEKVGIAKLADKRPFALSGGERQRVGIARALANSPKLVLADEPTGNLDPKTADMVFSYLLELARETKVAMMIVTHNHELARQTDRIINLA